MTRNQALALGSPPIIGLLVALGWFAGDWVLQRVNGVKA